MFSALKEDDLTKVAFSYLFSRQNVTASLKAIEYINYIQEAKDAFSQNTHAQTQKILLPVSVPLVQ